MAVMKSDLAMRNFDSRVRQRYNAFSRTTDTLSGGKVLHHGFGGRLSKDIDRDLGQEVLSLRSP